MHGNHGRVVSAAKIRGFDRCSNQGRRTRKNGLEQVATVVSSQLIAVDRLGGWYPDQGTSQGRQSCQPRRRIPNGPPRRMTLSGETGVMMSPSRSISIKNSPGNFRRPAASTVWPMRRQSVVTSISTRYSRRFSVRSSINSVRSGNSRRPKTSRTTVPAKAQGSPTRPTSNRVHRRHTLGKLCR